MHIILPGRGWRETEGAEAAESKATNLLNILVGREGMGCLSANAVIAGGNVAACGSLACEQTNQLDDFQSQGFCCRQGYLI